MSQKDNLGSFAGQRIFFNELEYALETTTLFGKTPQRSSQRNTVIRDFNTVPQFVPVAQPECFLVPAEGSFYPSVHGGTQTLICPITNQAPSRQLPQRLNVYQPTTQFLAPSTFSHDQTYNWSLPACNSLSSTHTNQYQPPESVGIVGASTHSQRIVQVPKATPKGVSNSSLVPGPWKSSSMPVKPPKRTWIIEKDVFAPGAEHQRMVNLRDIMGLPPLNKSATKIKYSMLPRSHSKKTSLQPKHRIDLRSILAESDTQNHAKVSSSSEIRNKGCSTSMLKVSASPTKKAKIEHKEEELDVGAMYALLAESIDLRAALAGGEIRIEEQNTSVKPSPALHQTSTARESNEAVNHADRPVHSKPSSSEVPVDAVQKESKQEMSKPKEQKETVSLEEIFSLDVSETQALFEDSFKDVDLDSMCDTYLCHAESPVDDNCLREILDSADFAELFESTTDDDDDTTTGGTITPMANENHPSAATKGSLCSVGADFVELIDSDDDDNTQANVKSHPSTTLSMRSVGNDFVELIDSDDDDNTQANVRSHPSTTLSMRSVGNDFVEVIDSDDDDNTTTSNSSHPSTTEGRLISVGADFNELIESSDDETTCISTNPLTDTMMVNPVDEPEVTLKQRSSMTIEELFLSNKERVMEQVATKQQECQHESLESALPLKAVLESFEQTNNGGPFPEYIPDMFLFSAKKPDVELNVIGQTVPAYFGQPFSDDISTPRPADACLKQAVGHYDTVPEGPLDMMRADDRVYSEKVYKADGFQYVFDEFKIPGNNVIVDPATLQTPRLPTPGRKRPHSHDSNYMCDDSQSAKKLKVDAGSWVECSNSSKDSVKSKKRRYNNKARKPTGEKWLPGNH